MEITKGGKVTVKKRLCKIFAMMAVTVIALVLYGQIGEVKAASTETRDIASCTFTLEYTEVVYDGTDQQRPGVTVQAPEGNVLREGLDYQVLDGYHPIYTNVSGPAVAPTRPATGGVLGLRYVTVQGMGTYNGYKILEYTIKKIPIDSAEVTLDETIFTYDGSPKQPQAVVTLQGKVLTKGVDYTLNYTNNIVEGTAQAVIVGIGVYTGEITKSFTILPYSSASDSVYDKDNTLISGNLIYSITDDQELEVEVAGASKKNISQLVIPATVEAEGKEYKVTSIGQKAFYKNTKLTSIVIGNQVTSIEDYAFYGCKKLKSITINSNSVVDISDNAIKGISKKAVIKVPKKLVKDYQKELKGKTGYKKTMKIKKK